MDWTHTALIFPGQGSQAVGMGKSVYDRYPAARAHFQQADDLLGFSLSKLCFGGPESALGDTINTQPALYVTSIATLHALKAEIGDIAPSAVAGHSLGELTALTAAGALDFADGVKLVRERGKLMKQAGETHPGAMAALIGTEMPFALDICEKASTQTGKSVVVANDNCPGQIVISGDVGALDRALALAEEAGLRKTVKLDVSIAAHSPLMASASDAFARAVDNTPFNQPAVPVYANISAACLTDIESIRSELRAQLTQPVRWTDSAQAMIDAGISTFVELGSGDVLTKLLRRIDRGTTRHAVHNVETLKAFANG